MNMDRKPPGSEGVPNNVIKLTKEEWVKRSKMSKKSKPQEEVSNVEESFDDAENEGFNDLTTKIGYLISEIEVAKTFLTEFRGEYNEGLDLDRKIKGLFRKTSSDLELSNFSKEAKKVKKDKIRLALIISQKLLDCLVQIGDAIDILEKKELTGSEEYKELKGMFRGIEEFIFNFKKATNFKEKEQIILSFGKDFK